MKYVYESKYIMHLMKQCMDTMEILNCYLSIANSMHWEGDFKRERPYLFVLQMINNVTYIGLNDFKNFDHYKHPFN